MKLTNKKGNVYVIAGLVIASLFIVLYLIIFFSQAGFMQGIAQSLDEWGWANIGLTKQKNAIGKDVDFALAKKLIKQTRDYYKRDFDLVITFKGIVDTDQGEKPFVIEETRSYKEYMHDKTVYSRLPIIRYNVKGIQGRFSDNDIDEIEKITSMSIMVKHGDSLLSKQKRDKPKTQDFVDAKLKLVNTFGKPIIIKDQERHEILSRLLYHNFEEKAIIYELRNFNTELNEVDEDENKQENKKTQE